MTLLRNKIFEDCVKAEAHNPVKIIDVAIQRFEMLIDEKIDNSTDPFEIVAYKTMKEELRK